MSDSEESSVTHEQEVRALIDELTTEREDLFTSEEELNEPILEEEPEESEEEAVATEEPEESAEEAVARWP